MVRGGFEVRFHKVPQSSARISQGFHKAPQGSTRFHKGSTNVPQGSVVWPGGKQCVKLRRSLCSWAEH